MKTNLPYLLIVMLFVACTGCLNKGPRQAESQKQADTLTVPDTGFTGIRRYYSKNLLVKEVTFKNGIRQGLMKTFYQNGKLYQTFWYENGMREDTARWYFEDGRVFRETLYKKDSMDGFQTQYYKSGMVRARLSYVRGIRTPFLEEFTSEGTKISGYPEIIVDIKDDYSKNGTCRIYLELSKKDVKANFYRGEYIDGLFMPKKYIKLNINEYKGYLTLRKSGASGNNFVVIIAEISTGLGNKYLTYKKIDLPYNDLK